jgi:glycerophosphoryl diester phosphodiesterase
LDGKFAQIIFGEIITRPYRQPMKPFLLLLMLVLLASPESLLAQKLHKKSFKNARQVQEFLKHREGGTPIIAGHRGTIEDGYPENSIESMEYTLKHTFAIFEIDPRLTKDSVVVLMHDATLDRTTNGTGLIQDYTYAELQKLFLKDARGNITPYKIPTLDAVFRWAKGKTIVNLDNKGVPYSVVADLIDKHKAWNFVMITSHSPEHAQYYLKRNGGAIFSAHIKTPEVFKAYDAAGIPFTQMIAYIGPHIKESNQAMYQLLNARGAKAMISSASSYDKLGSAEERAEAYRKIIADGASILESDFPIEVSKTLNTLKNPKR